MVQQYGIAGYGGGSPQQSQSTGSSSSQSSTQVVPGMMSVYSDLLARNQQNYSNVLSAYNTGQQQQQSQLPGIYRGYQGVQSGVMDTLGMGAALGKNGNWGVAQPAATAIGQAYQQNLANNQQQMASAGLGNTTALGNAQNQATQGAAQQYGALGAQLAQTAAGYQSQIGQAGLGARMQGLGLQSQLAAQRGSTLGGYHFANTAGSLTGGFGSSSGQQQSSGRGGLPGGGSSSGQDQMQPYNLESGAGRGGGFAGGGGGGGYAGGGVAGMPAYNFGGSSGGVPGTNMIGDGINRRGGFSYGQNWGPAGPPSSDFTGAMNQQPDYQQPSMTDENPSGFKTTEPTPDMAGGFSAGQDQRYDNEFLYDAKGNQHAIPIPKGSTPEQKAKIMADYKAKNGMR